MQQQANQSEIVSETVWLATIKWILRRYPDAKTRRALHNEYNGERRRYLEACAEHEVDPDPNGGYQLLGISIQPGVIIGRQLHHTQDQLEDWNGRLQNKLNAQLQDQGRVEPKKNGPP
ncbi:MAG: hypothetical protein AAF918_17005 [Pseudomonadota bacterium]